jgi:hypothetical protein
VSAGQRWGTAKARGSARSLPARCDKAPVSAAEAAAVILNGVRDGAWRIPIGEDAKVIDAAVRATPEAAYDYAELFSALQATGRSVR